jgi:hypothetical protein
MNEEVKKPAERPRSAVIIPFPRHRIKRIIITKETAPNEAAHSASKSS